MSLIPSPFPPSSFAALSSSSPPSPALSPAPSFPSPLHPRLCLRLPLFFLLLLSPSFPPLLRTVKADEVDSPNSLPPGFETRFPPPYSPCDRVKSRKARAIIQKLIYDQLPNAGTIQSLLAATPSSPSSSSLSSSLAASISSSSTPSALSPQSILSPSCLFHPDRDQTLEDEIAKVDYTTSSAQGRRPGSSGGGGGGGGGQLWKCKYCNKLFKSEMYFRSTFR